MDEREIIAALKHPEGAAGFAQVLAMFIGAALGGNLLSPEPFRLKRFCGEMVFASMGAVALWHFGVMQKLEPSAVIVLGFSASLGMFRQLTWITRFMKSLPITFKFGARR